MMDKVNLIFPVAGKGERFGGTFKPFLKIGDITFIEKTISSFSRTDLIEKIYFICTEQQNREFDVYNNLRDIIVDMPFDLVVIPKDTSGPYQTIKEALLIRNITGKSIICDCDHYLNADEIIQNLSSDQSFDVVIPTYNIEKNEFKNWSKVITSNGSIEKIVEKDPVDDGLEFKGIIGCIGFKRIEDFLGEFNFKYISEFLNHLICEKGKTCLTIDAKNCLFYGDPEMYEKTVEELRSKMTIFCDIDGVLIKHNPHSVSEPELNHMIDGFNNLNEWKKIGHKIVLTTARSDKNREGLIKLLEIKGVKYDDLVTGCNPGQRILINDRKPSSPFLPQSISVEITRDSGISGFDINKIREESGTRIIRDLSGNSFAKTYLVSNNSNFFIRKHILKSEETQVHYEKLKRQLNDIKRLNFLKDGIAPRSLKEYDSDYEYYYDLEYLSGYRNLSEFTPNVIAPLLHDFIEVFKKDIYSLRKPVNGEVWMKRFLENKIYNKLDSYSKMDEVFKNLIESDNVVINGKNYPGLRKSLDTLDYSILNPSFICPVHGDFTLENMMSNGEKIKTIDMDGSDYFDVPEQDLGKLSQSILSRYHIWNKIENPVTYFSNNEFLCDSEFFDAPSEGSYGRIWNLWRDILSKNDVLENAMFYMSCYFIRFVPFRMQKNISHGYFAIIMAIVWINKIKNKNKMI